MAHWLRLVRFVAKGSKTPTQVPDILIGEPVDPELDVGLAIYEGGVVRVRVYKGRSILDPGEPTERIAEVGILLSPIGEDEVGTIRGIGLNYHNHAKECGLDLPKIPLLFLKASTALQHPFPAKIVIPKCTIADEATDAESEIGVELGRDCKNATVENALDFVLGYTAINDVSSRVAQARSSQWDFAKGFDTSCPMGPCIVSSRSCADPRQVRVRGFRNGKLMQDSLVDDMIFDIPHLIAFLSQGTTLRRGTLILTGTPAGVGYFQQPREILTDGDEYRVQLSHGIGTLINAVCNER